MIRHFIYLALIAALAPLSIIMPSATDGGGKLSPSAAPVTGHGTHVNLILEKDCITKPIVLIDCDLSDSDHPKNCKYIKIVFRPKCGSLQIEPNSAKEGG